MNEQLVTTTVEELEGHGLASSRPTTRLAGRIVGFLREGVERFQAEERHLPHIERRHYGTLLGLFSKPQDGNGQRKSSRNIHRR